MANEFTVIYSTLDEETGLTTERHYYRFESAEQARATFLSAMADGPLVVQAHVVEFIEEVSPPERPIKPYTVILALPDHVAGDQCCAPDTVRREHVEAENSQTAYLVARRQAVSALADLEVEPDDFAPIAVFPGHIVDEYRSG